MVSKYSGMSKSQIRSSINQSVRSGRTTAKNYTVKDSKSGKVISKVGSGGSSSSSSSSSSSTPISAPTSTIVVGVSKDVTTGQQSVTNIGKDLSQADKQEISNITSQVGRLSSTVNPVTGEVTLSKTSIVQNQPGAGVVNPSAPVPSFAPGINPTVTEFMRQQRIKQAAAQSLQGFSPRTISPSNIQDNQNLVGQSTTLYGGLKPSTDLQAEDRFSGFQDYKSEQFFKISGVKKIDPPKIIPRVYSTPTGQKGSKYQKAISDLKPFSRDVTMIRNADGSFRTKTVGERIKSAAFIPAEAAAGIWEGGVGLVKGLTVNLPETVLGFASIIANKEFRQEAAAGMGTYYSGADSTPFRGLGRVTFDVATLFVGAKSLKGIKLKASTYLDKKLPSRPFVVEEIAAGSEIHKGSGFSQYKITYKGDTFVRQGKTFGVRRVQPFQPSKPFTWLDKLKGRTPGQIKYFDSVAGDFLLRDVPSEFSTPSSELAIASNTGKQTVISVTEDSKFFTKSLKKQGSYTSIAGGGKALESISGRPGVGGAELSQFFSAPTTKPIAGFPAGTSQGYIHYSGLKPEGYLPKKFVLSKSKPGIIFQQEKIFSPTSKSLSKTYVDLSQEAYFKPGEFSLSSSTLKGIRTELEVLKVPGTQTKLSKVAQVNIPGYGSLKAFYGSDIPLSTSQKVTAIQSNIDFLKTREVQILELVESGKAPQLKAESVIVREKNVISSLESYKSFLETGKKPSSTSPVKSSNSNVPIADADYSNFLKEFNLDSSASLSSSAPKYNYYTSSDVVADVSRISPVVSVSSSRSLVSSSISGSYSPVVAVSSVSSSSSSSVSNFSKTYYPKSSSPSVSTKSSSSSSSLSVTPSSSVVSSSYSFSPSSSIISSSKYSGFSKAASSSSRMSAAQYDFLSSSALLPPSKKRKKKKSSSFLIQVRSKGTFKTVGKAASASEAFKKGKFFTGSTSAASFRIKTKEGRTVLRPLTDNRYRTSKKEKGVYIQKRSFRISSAGEKRDITYKGIRAQRLK